MRGQHRSLRGSEKARCGEGSLPAALEASLSEAAMASLGVNTPAT